jgi:YVTN family beta-propeller protein
MRLFCMNFGQVRMRLVKAGVVLAAASLVAGCGSTYRPVTTPINTPEPAGQPTSYAVVVSAPSATADGYATIVDYSGDTIMAQVSTGPGPSTLTVDEAGSIGYTINSDNTITNFPISSTLMQKNVTNSTLQNTAQPVNLFSPSSGLWAADLCGTYLSSVCGGAADVFSGSPKAQVSSIPLAATTPVMVVGPSTVGQRDFAISQNISSATGMECNISRTAQPLGDVTPIEVSSNTTDTPIPVGKCPVYAVESNNSNSNSSQRLFVLNRGSDTITVIDTKNDTLNSCTPFADPNTGRTVTCHPTLPLSTASLTADNAPVNCDITTNPTCGMTAIAGPVYAEYSTATSQLVVANYDGGTVSIIDVSMDVYGNDSSTFGTTYTVSVGKNPASVTVLGYDGTRAYTANQTDETVTVVNLSSHTVEKTLPVSGHPRTVVSTQNSEYGKVYVASPDSSYLTVIHTNNPDPDTVDTAVLVTGNIVDVRVSTQDGESGNNNNVSRVAGYGQPCNLPLSVFDPTSSSTPTLANCQVQYATSLK